MKEAVLIRMDEDLKKSLQKLAQADHRNLSEFIRVQLIKLVEQTKIKK